MFMINVAPGREGAKDYLYLNENGIFSDYSSRLPGIIDFNISCASADIDKDYDDDIYISVNGDLEMRLPDLLYENIISSGIQDDNTFNLLKPNNFIVSYNNGNISIRYTIPYSSSVKLEAYDIKGKLVKVIADKFMHKGSYSVNWDSKRFGAGVYFIKLSVNGSEVSNKFTIIK